MLGRFLVRGLFLSNLISTYRLKAIAKFLALINAMELNINTLNPNHPLAATIIAININAEEKIVCSNATNSKKSFIFLSIYLRPRETSFLNPFATVRSLFSTLSFFTFIKNPEVGLGVVGTNTQYESSNSLVTNPIALTSPNLT